MSSAASLQRAGRQAEVTKHHVCCTNGIGDPRIVVGDVEPGSIVRFGIDDDMTCLVVGNFVSEIHVIDAAGDIAARPRRTLLLYGCFCDEPDEFDAPGRPYEEGRLMTQTFGDLDTVSVLLEPGSY
jgi:hypothetical protein